MDKDYILEIEGLSKGFPGVQALDKVSFNVERGTIHALVGENGAGKSTLIKILAGIYRADAGNVTLNGQAIAFKTPHEARVAGISVVHQEMKLAEPLSVAENLFVGGILTGRGNLVDWKEMRRRAKEIIDNLGVEIDVRAPVDSLTVAKKQIVEVCRAVNMNCKLMIMDEPSATLTDRELEILFGIAKKLRGEGITIIYISHRLDEIFNLADNVTVLRDGLMVNTVPVRDVTKRRLISMMVGRELGLEYPKEAAQIGDVLLEVKNLVRNGVLHDISFNVRQGEVLGISGLVGSGRTELARAILGIDKIDSGEVYVRGKKKLYRSFREAIKDGLGLIPEDRKTQGLVQIFSVKRNICMVSLDKIIKKGIVSARLEQQYGEEYAKKLRIMTPSMNTQVQYLSGGNQQKVVVTKWMMQNSEILFMDEPTRGIDVGAKTEIYHLINDLVKQGKTVIMISSEMPEILGMCDRIVILHEGKMVGELMRDEATQERIMEKCV
ncbi:MAG: sugar ABC transporter ATP-binding protein [Clostridiales bacterium]|jgi:ABC-type sugar transport system ATPase subunit|nr:sugar ABC transporter ATP-binding protein [Clostridiales bacterium]